MEQFQLQQSQLFQPKTIDNRFRNIQSKLKHNKTGLEDYQLKTIGEGGYGSVRRAIHKPTRQIVAVKILKVENCDSEQVALIDRQIAMQQKLIHQHIAQIYEVIKKDNKVYIFMEYCPNGQLLNFLIKNGSMRQRDAAKMFHQVLSALIYMNKMGISHRDIKPENILLDKDRNAKLVDFGFSCQAPKEGQQLRTTVCGIPSYTAPEVLLRKGYCAQLMDVWSLGVTLYTMLAAELPFEDKDNNVKIGKIMNFQWSAKPYFSPNVRKLLSTIFVEANRRVTLKGMLRSDLLLLYHFDSPSSIDCDKETILIENSILAIAERECQVDRKRVIQSVRKYKLDRHHAIYYLLLKREIQSSDFPEISRFTKQHNTPQRSSLTKLKPMPKDLKAIGEKSLLKRLNFDLEIHLDAKKRFELNNCNTQRVSTQKNTIPTSKHRRTIDCLSLEKK